jgi:hypothetical protein
MQVLGGPTWKVLEVEPFCVKTSSPLMTETLVESDPVALAATDTVIVSGEEPPPGWTSI